MDVPFPAMAFLDRVQLYRLAPGTDTDAGKTQEFSPTGRPIPCRVGRSNARVKDFDTFSQTETEYEIAFPSRPPGEKDDRYAWLDPSGQEVDRLVITQVATPRDASGRLWTAFGVIVQ